MQTELIQYKTLDEIRQHIDEVTSKIDEELFLQIVDKWSGIGIVEVKKQLNALNIPNHLAYLARLLEIPNIIKSGMFDALIETSQPGERKLSPALYKAMAKAPFYLQVDGVGKTEFYGFKFEELLKAAE